MNTNSTIWHDKNLEDLEKLLNTNFKNGLSKDKVIVLQNKFGKNKLPEKKQLSKIRIFFGQFKSPLIYILLFAGIVTLCLKEVSDSIIIFISVLLNAIVGYVQEKKSSEALNELQKVLGINALVIRNGAPTEISSSELTIGDIVILNPGDKVPADGRLIECSALKVNESALTGEWVTAEKFIDPLPIETPLADRKNMVYMGTVIEDGKGIMVVTSIGINTEIGKISDLVKNTKEDLTPYQQKLAKFSKLLSIIISIICVIILIIGLLAGDNFVEIFTIAIAVAVAAIPEGLPMSMTIVLALGMKNILKRHGLVRKLTAAETLGSTSIIATDKTGTLTHAKMKVAGIYSLCKKSEKDALIDAVLSCSVAINNSENSFEITGESTEKAIVTYSVEKNIFKNLHYEDYKIDEIPFDSKYKYSAALRKSLSKSGKNIYILGAPEAILKKAKYYENTSGNIVEITDKIRKKLEDKYEELTSQGYRVLGAAHKKSTSSRISFAQIKDFVISGFIYLEDPIREEAKYAIKSCKKAGMMPIIITGDHKLTAKAIANKLGMNVKDKNIIDGEYLESLSDEEFDNIIKNIKVYARVEPKHKMRIVEAWQRKGQVVAMTGDGINDAPALKQADIGVALGSGTEVAKEVADLVLLSDDFSVIVAAVEEGRAIIDNIRKIITYLLSNSLTEIILITASIITRIPLPLTAVQILWVNIVTDGFPNIALAFEKKENDLMSHKPQRKDSSLINREMAFIILTIGLLTDLILLGLLFYLRGLDIYSLVEIRSIMFACLTMGSISYVFSCKSLRRNIWKINIFDNKLLVLAWFIGIAGMFAGIYIPFLNTLLGTTPLTFDAWKYIIFMTVINATLIEVVKFIFIKARKTDSELK